MDHQTEIRVRLAKMYSLLSSVDASVEQLDAACLKLSEAVAIMDGTTPVLSLSEKEKVHG